MGSLGFIRHLKASGVANKRSRGDLRQLTWCNYDTALIDGGKGGLEQSALPLVDDLVDTASDI